MRTVAIGAAFILIAGNMLWQAGRAWAEDAKMDEFLSEAAASNDFQGVLRALPSVRPLDHRDPPEFLRLMKVGIPVLRAAASHPDARRELYDLLPQVLEMTSPTNISDAADYFRLKKDVILEYLNLEDVRTDKAWVTKIARFVGETRSRLIPDYRNEGTAQPGLHILLQAGVNDAAGLTNPVLRDAYEQAVARNELEMQMNRLQSVLREVNEIMSFHVMRAATRILPTEAHASNFVDDLVNYARLTEHERMKLQGVSAAKSSP